MPVLGYVPVMGEHEDSNEQFFCSFNNLNSHLLVHVNLTGYILGERKRTEPLRAISELQPVKWFSYSIQWGSPVGYKVDIAEPFWLQLGKTFRKAGFGITYFVMSSADSQVQSILMGLFLCFYIT